MRKKHTYLIVVTAIAVSFLPVIVSGQGGSIRYKSGEKLRFLIYYGPFDAGYVDTELNMVSYQNTPVFHSKLVAYTKGLADRLYKVRDEYQAWFDLQHALPVKSIRDIHEGKYTKYNVVRYDRENLKVINIDRDTFEIPPDIRDMVSVFHYIRNLDYEHMDYDQIIPINTWFDNEIFPFDMRYIGTEIIKTKAGKFECIRLVPFVEPGRVFKSEDDMTIWLSNDRNRVPVRVNFNLTVGAIICDLIEYSGLKY